MCNTHLCVCVCSTVCVCWCVTDGAVAGVSGELYPPPVSLPERKRPIEEKKRQWQGPDWAWEGGLTPAPLPLWEEVGLGSQTWIQIPRLTLICCVTLNKCLLWFSVLLIRLMTPPPRSCGAEGDKACSFISHYSTVLWGHQRVQPLCGPVWTNLPGPGQPCGLWGWRQQRPQWGRVCRRLYLPTGYLSGYPG